MRFLKFLAVDLALIAGATVAALVLRDNLELDRQHLNNLLPYLGLTVSVAIPVLTAFRADRSIWRLSVMSDYLNLVTATALIVAAATALGFLITRLDGVPRSLPLLQALLIMFALVGVRVLARLRHNLRKQKKVSRGAVLTEIVEPPGERETVLVVGINRVAELYLQAVEEFAADRVTIAGLLGRSDRHSGRMVQQHKIWGRTAELVDLLPELEVHGFFVNRIVITSPFEKLSEDSRAALMEVERSTDIELDFLSESLRFGERWQKSAAGQMRQDKAGRDPITFSIAAMAPSIKKRQMFWRVKSALDFVAAAALLVLLAPLFLLVSLLASSDRGQTLFFTQLRPGLGGRPFKLYKFCTMAASRDLDGNLVPDEERSSPIGRFLRRFRLDELPQLINVVKGDMSFVGPRPLLPRDQPAAYMARLLVRPGLTGWAQVRGGREVGPADKAALDIWYVQNASLLLDLKILARTVPMVIMGEKSNADAVRAAWDDLRKANICSNDNLAEAKP